MKPIDKNEPNRLAKVDTPQENPTPQRSAEPPRDKLSNPGRSPINNY